MVVNNKIEIMVNNTTIRWYKNKGYNIPTHTVQLWANKNGKRVKNGIEERVANGTKILVNIEDLPPHSNQQIKLKCKECGREYYTTWQFYKSKKTDKCSECQKKLIINTGSHAYWVNKLIANNPNARCNISQEIDKRFLVLHHLLSRGNGGLDEEGNYVILSSNYHLAFHNSLGGTQYGCTPNQYYEFKEKEKLRIG